MAGKVTPKITWLGHATFRIESPQGKVVVIDPWVSENPSCPKEKAEFAKIDLMLVTHGHFDHIGDAVALGKKHNPNVVAIYEICAFLEEKGLGNVIGMNKGGTVEVAGLGVTMVGADHSSSILDDDGKLVYGGEACGFVVEFEGGFKVYHAGDTNLFGDMKLIGELYKPDLALLPIGGHYTMGPKEAAVACRLLGVRSVIPMHFGTFPILKGSPQALRKAAKDIRDLEVIELRPGETYGA